MTSHNPTRTPAAPACQPDVVRVPLFRVVLWAGWARTNGEARRVVRGGSIRVDLEQELDENRLIGAGQYVSIRQGVGPQDRLTLTEHFILTSTCGDRGF
ncbi:hypothetical protein [Acetobacter senegalensis]|uniref:hypothetical protein n=1 Tax=Acetobacter senegalensis TaxID=446692 RepID=UPI00128E905B|nr:hypothetical protein [Acetobacter senegalensis]MPQ75263.1 hypothetical protein [Acetobacter senegalensis]